MTIQTGSAARTWRRSLLTVGVVAVSATMLGTLTHAEDRNRFVTHGGAHERGVITRVTSLADSGPGTLREAIETVKQPNVIVFEVGGEIALDEDLYLRKSGVTIAGQTAPSPGITLTGASVRVRASDIAIEHIAIRPGLAAEPADRADALTIGGGARELARIRVRNVSLSWSKDELAALANPTGGPVSFTHSILAEALRTAGHPKGEHSMAFLVRDAPEGVTIAGNLFVSNVHRNPVLASDVKAVVRNNWIINPRFNGVHMYLDRDADLLEARIDGNVMTPGRDTKTTRTISMPSAADILAAGSTIIAGDNPVIPMNAIDPVVRADAARADGDMAPRAVPSHVLRFAGSRPRERNAVDRRIIDTALAGAARVVDAPPDRLNLSPTRQPFVGPEKPFALSPLGNTRIELWLEEQHIALGGAQGIRLN